MSKLLFLARPAHSFYEPESDYAAKCAVSEDSPITVHSACFRQSMTCSNCNKLLCHCMSAGNYDYFAMLHSDVAPAEGWADALVGELEKHNLDVIHAPCAFKGKEWLTSTAIGYSADMYSAPRRITMTELQSLPQTFDVETIREVYDAGAERILCNTGCMVWKLGDWVHDFPGFTMMDSIEKHGGKWRAVTVSEDYVFAHWCADNGVRVGATKVETKHFGRQGYSTADAWGPARDEEYFARLAAREAVA